MNPNPQLMIVGILQRRIVKLMVKMVANESENAINIFLFAICVGGTIILVELDYYGTKEISSV